VKSENPLILRGAHQGGKIGLLQEFGGLNYDNVVYVNFERLVVMRDLFLQHFDVNRILIALRIQIDEDVSPARTLIILDEIQEAKGGVTLDRRKVSYRRGLI
jgi:predicted AAA+ superfamily ATPase